MKNYFNGISLKIEYEISGLVLTGTYAVNFECA